MNHFNKIAASFSFVIIISAMGACKKNNPVEDNTATILQSKSWKVTALTISPAIGGLSDIYNGFWQDCERDNLYKFLASNNFEFDEGGSKCSPTDDQTRPGSWTYNSTTKLLHYQINGNGGADYWDFTIIEINDNFFKATATDVSGGVTTTETWTFSKQ